MALGDFVRLADLLVQSGLTKDAFDLALLRLGAKGLTSIRPLHPSGVTARDRSTGMMQQLRFTRCPD